MKILIIGGAGTIGSLVTNYFTKSGDEVLIASRNSGQYQVDLTKADSIKALFDQIGEVDAIISIAGEAKWALFNDLTEDDFLLGLNSKLMGQVNLVRVGKDYLSKGGSITLSTGILADDPVEKTTSAAMVNGAIHSFVKAASLEISDFRLNAISLGMVAVAYDKYKSFFPGHHPVSTEKVVRAYERSVKGKDNGRIIKEYE